MREGGQVVENDSRLPPLFMILYWWMRNILNRINKLLTIIGPERLTFKHAFLPFHFGAFEVDLL